MKVFYEDTDNGHTLPVSIPGDKGTLKAPAFIHHSQSWADQLRTLWLDKHYPTDSPIVWDGPTAAITAPPVVHGEHEMICGDQRFYEVPD